MARPILFLALVLLAVVGLASFATTTDAAATAPSLAVATSPAGGDDDVGTLEIDGNEDAAPVGGPVPDGVFTNAPAPAPIGGAAALEVSAIGGVAAAVAAFFL